MLILGGILELVSSVATLGAPLILHELLPNPEQASAVFLVIITLAATVSGRAKDQVCCTQAIWCEGMLQTVLFEKTLNLSPTSRTLHSPASIINMSAVDINFISNYVMKIHDIWSAPIQIIGIATLTIRLMGWSALYGMCLRCNTRTMCQRLCKAFFCWGSSFSARALPGRECRPRLGRTSDSTIAV
ncbi:hypothetical protein LZ32DRAFT_91952 [Colletotrichum eremochloae]|nr:hypothetical protein LZ32DRAFT_91952 [Colletotrichum eremochloae]